MYSIKNFFFVNNEQKLDSKMKVDIFEFHTALMLIISVIYLKIKYISMMLNTTITKN